MKHFVLVAFFAIKMDKIMCVLSAETIQFI
jgi:hypothetical protein